MLHIFHIPTHTILYLVVSLKGLTFADCLNWILCPLTFSQREIFEERQKGDLGLFTSYLPPCLSTDVVFPSVLQLLSVTHLQVLYLGFCDFSLYMYLQI